MSLPFLDVFLAYDLGNGLSTCGVTVSIELLRTSLAQVETDVEGLTFSVSKGLQKDDQLHLRVQTHGH